MITSYSLDRELEFKKSKIRKFEDIDYENLYFGSFLLNFKDVIIEIVSHRLCCVKVVYKSLGTKKLNNLF